MTSMKKYVVGACVATALAAVPVAAFASAPHAAIVQTGSVKVVAPGEKVAISTGLTTWLTKDGQQCWQFGAVGRPKCGNVAGGKTGVRLAVLSEEKHVFVAGAFSAAGDPAGVKARTLNGTSKGVVLTLAGNPGWGAWYVDAGPAKPAPIDAPPSGKNFVKGVTVYDPAGKTIAEHREPTPFKVALGTSNSIEVMGGALVK